MSRRKKSKRAPVIVAVEGVDFLHFIRNRIMDDPDFSGIWLYDFKEEGATLNYWLGEFRKTSTFRTTKAFGIIRDAEFNYSHMEQSIQDSLNRHGYPVPQIANSITHAANEPNTAYLLLPHNQPSGCLEHAILNSVGKTAHLACAKTYLACLNVADPNPNWEAKVLVHTLIAGSIQPEMTLGTSVKVGLWDWEHPSLRIILDFLRLLKSTTEKTT